MRKLLYIVFTCKPTYQKTDQRQQTSVLTYGKINTGEQLEQTGDMLMQETSPTSGEEVVVRCFHVQTYMLKN